MRPSVIKALSALTIILFLVYPGMTQNTPNVRETLAPILTLAVDELDMGVLSMAAPTKVLALTLRNAGQNTLEIQTIRTSCACLQVTAHSRSILPGEESFLLVELDMRLHESPVDEQILIYSNDPVRPLVKAKVRANLQLPIIWTPKMLPIGWVPRNKELPHLRFRTIKIAPNDGRPIGPLRVTTSSPHFSVETTKESGSFRLRIRIETSVPLGPFEHTIRIETRHPEIPVIEIPVRGGILGAVYATVHWVDFGLIEPGRPAVAKFLVKNLSDRELHIIKADPHVAAMAVVDTMRQKNDIEVTIQLPHPPPLHNLEGRLDLHTNHPEHPLISVPLRGWVWAPKPFELVAAEGREPQLLALVKEALFRRNAISAEDVLTRILGGVRDERTASLLLQALSDDHWLIRTRAAEVLGALGHTSAMKALQRAVTDDPDEDVRRAAVTALAQIAAGHAIPHLLLAIQDNDAWVRAEAVAMLGQIGDARVLPQLRPLVMDPDEDVREVARQALGILAGGIDDVSVPRNGKHER
jgi:hypothetical protein